MLMESMFNNVNSDMVRPVGFMFDMLNKKVARSMGFVFKCSQPFKKQSTLNDSDQAHGTCVHQHHLRHDAANGICIQPF